MDNSFMNRTVPYPAEGEIDFQPIMRQVYVWMGLGTLLTAVVAYLTANTPLINLAMNPIVLIVAMVAELGMVLGLSFGLNRIPVVMAIAFFFIYAALNGFTLSLILLAYTSGTVFSAFIATSALFGAMSIVGYTTKMDLTRFGTYLMMGLIGLLIAMVVNFFLNSGPLNLIISIIGVLIFTALTAYDTQKIRKMAVSASADGEVATRLSIYGALTLYLDFINMFMYMLRLMGGRRQ